MNITHCLSLYDIRMKYLGRILVASSMLVGASLFFVSSAQAAPCDPASIRWASSSNIVYVMGPSTVCTLTEIDAIADKARLTLVDPANKIWQVESNIWLQNGARLNLHGTSLGGDVNELRLGPTVVFVRAYWGTIDVNATKVTSWSGSGPDTNHGDGRSYLQVKSFLDPDGVTPRESRMNITNSDIGYLGYYAAESYGLSWKVLAPTGADIYDRVGVLGDVVGNRIHHNFFGAYTWGADAMVWRNNEFDNNVQYGLDPHDNSDNLVIEDNRAHHNGTHGIICSRFCDHITIRRNKSYNNGGHGIMLHRLTDFSTVTDNEVYNNVDAGIAIFDSHNNIISNNNVHDNGKGIRLSVGSSNNTISDNQVVNNRQYGLYFFKGSDTPTESSNNGRPKNNTFVNNTITGSGIYGLKMKETDNNIFRDNDFINNAKTLLIEASTGNRFENNLITRNTAAGITLSGATGHVITGNTIDRNGPIGVYLKKGSNNTQITNNIISNHSKYGIRITGSTGTIIQGNTFSGNGKNVGS